MSGRTRVLWVVKGLGRGGAEQLLVEHARLGDHDRFDYQCAYLLESKQDLVDDLRDAGVQVHELWREGRALTRLPRLVRRVDPDVIHVHSPIAAGVVRLASNFPTVYSEHNVWARYRVPTRILNRVTYGRDAHRFAVSTDIVDGLPARWRDHVEVLHHGIDVASAARRGAARAELRAALGVTDDEVLVVTVANTRPKKDLPNLLRAASVAVALEPAIRFMHAGSGPEEAELHALAGTLGLGDRFRFLGKRTDAVELIAAADVFCLSSLHEGLPVTVMESLAVGTPVVATAVGGLAEAITDGVEGVLVPAADADALARALVRVAQDASLRASLAAGAASAAPRFDATRAVGRIESVYDEVAAVPWVGGSS